MRGDPTHQQPDPGGGREERLVRRLILEAIPALARWAENKDPITKDMIQATARKKGLYEQGQGWEEILEEFTGRYLELLRLPTETKWPILLTTGKHPALDRIEELGKTAEETLVVCWHASDGAVVFIAGGEPQLRGKLGVKTHIETETESGLATEVWCWDRRNFSKE